VIRFGEDSPGPSELTLAVPGRHNLLNARAALAAVELAAAAASAGGGPAGSSVERAAEALAGFPGVARRLEYKGRCAGADIYDDYAHHPTEVRAALEALRERRPARLLAVFQPHLYSRTKALAEDFGAALALADEAVVLDVYPAREEPVGELAGVSGKLVADAACERMNGRPVCWAPTIAAALSAVRRRLAADETVVTIGAGDVFKLSEALVGEGER
jgi:UDP-N-acetylmuramate--alanine ligase